jgi:hypothetical protein
MTWSSQTYLLATQFGECPSGPGPLCVPNSVVVSRVRPASGDLWDDSGIDVASTIPSLGLVPRHAAIVSDGANSYVMWNERADIDGGSPSIIRVVRLDAVGNVLGSPVTLAQGISLTGQVQLAWTSFGLIAAWPEPDPYAPDDTVITLKRLDASLSVVDSLPPVVARTFVSWGSRSIVASDHPDALLIAWSAQSPSQLSTIVMMGRIDCVPK